MERFASTLFVGMEYLVFVINLRLGCSHWLVFGFSYVFNGCALHVNKYINYAVFTELMHDHDFVQSYNYILSA